MCEIHCTIVILPADMRVSQESDWNTAESARVFSSVTLVVRVFGRTSVLRQTKLRTDVRLVSRLSKLLDQRACPLLNRHLVVSCCRSTVVLTRWSGADQRRRVVLRHRRDGPGAPTTPPCRDGHCRRDRREVAPVVYSRATSLTTPAVSRRRRRCRERIAESPSAAAAAAACCAAVVACAAAVCVHVAVVCVCLFHFI